MSCSRYSSVPDYQTLLEKLAEIGVQPYCDDLDKRAFVVWHQLPDDLVVCAESFFRDDWGSKRGSVESWGRAILSVPPTLATLLCEC